VPGAFAKALATIQGALALGLRVTSGMTITPQNCHQIGEVAGLMERLGVDFSCNLTEQGANFHSTGPGPSLSPPQRAQVLAALQDFPHHYYMDNLARQMQGRDRTLPCYAGMSSYFLAPDGDLLLCNLLQTPLGNLRQDSWAQIAQSQKAWDMRRQALSCSCWSQCEVKNAAASAPWHIVCWWAGSPAKAATIRRLARTARHHLP
jgi:MoaA/NifB/PqqE/SkfB family radical SAM enzyme